MSDHPDVTKIKLYYRDDMLEFHFPSPVWVDNQAVDVAYIPNKGSPREMHAAVWKLFNAIHALGRRPSDDIDDENFSYAGGLIDEAIALSHQGEGVNSSRLAKAIYDIVRLRDASLPRGPQGEDFDKWLDDTGRSINGFAEHHPVIISEDNPFKGQLDRNR